MSQDAYESAKQMNRVAGECLEKGDYEGALENFSKALEFMPKDQLESRARLCNNMGHVFVMVQRYEGALSSFRNAMELYEKLGNKVEFGSQLGNIGSVHRDTKEWDTALESYFKALEVFEGIDHRGGIADQCSNIGYAYSMQGDPQKAFKFFVKAKGLYDQAGDERKSQLCDQNIKVLQPYAEEQD
jgi:tetratricopeptide (TPR) repeat protein